MSSIDDDAADRERKRALGKAIALDENKIASIDRLLLDRHGTDLVKLAVRSIQYGFTKNEPPKVAVNTFAKELRVKRATFVTLERNGHLRGCIGSITAVRPLVLDVVENAFRAAFRDPRFSPLSPEERKGLGISLSVLTPMNQIAFKSQAELLSQVKPGYHGLLIQDGEKRSVFLPQVWEQLPAPEDFLSRLKVKAGFSPDYWSKDLQAWTFAVQKVPPLGIRRQMARRKAESTLGTLVTEENSDPLGSDEESG